jgi:1-acyl-sn-glycerol-3-phosphate acyltransferase
MNTFRPGVERIIASTPVPVVSMCLQGLWGSVFSRAGGNVLLRILKGIRSRIDFSVGEVLAPELVTAAKLQQQVATLCERGTD